MRVKSIDCILSTFSRAEQQGVRNTSLAKQQRDSVKHSDTNCKATIDRGDKFPNFHWQMIMSPAEREWDVAFAPLPNQYVSMTVVLPPIGKVYENAVKVWQPVQPSANAARHIARDSRRKTRDTPPIQLAAYCFHSFTKYKCRDGLCCSP